MNGIFSNFSKLMYSAIGTWKGEKHLKLLQFITIRVQYPSYCCPVFKDVHLLQHVNNIRAWPRSRIALLTLLHMQHLQCAVQYVIIEGLCQREAYVPILLQFFKLLGIRWNLTCWLFLCQNISLCFFSLIKRTTVLEKKSKWSEQWIGWHNRIQVSCQKGDVL